MWRREAFPNGLACRRGPRLRLLRWNSATRMMSWAIRWSTIILPLHWILPREKRLRRSQSMHLRWMMYTGHILHSSGLIWLTLRSSSAAVKERSSWQMRLLRIPAGCGIPKPMKSWIRTVSAGILEMWKKHIRKYLRGWVFHKIKSAGPGAAS